MEAREKLFKTKYAAVVEAKRLEKFLGNESLLPVYASSKAKILPYQIAAARFALRSDYLKGCILCDEGSLGKTYEALLVAGQKWYEGKENILIILPPNLIAQWFRKLKTDFTIPYVFWNNTKNIPDDEGIVITTYDCALRKIDKIKERDWDLVIFDEADVLSNYEKEMTIKLKDCVGGAFKLLLTPTPITKDIRDIYGLIHFIDESVLPDADWFYRRYFRKPENYPELTSWVSQFCFRSLKSQTTEYVNFSRRIPITIDYPLIKEEKELYKLISTYIASDNKTAYPEMDGYNLSLLFFKTISSSSQALVKLLKAPIERSYGMEKAVLQEIRKLAAEIPANSKILQLLNIMKPVFKLLKSVEVNQIAFIFVENSATIDALERIFLKEEYNTIKYESGDSLEKFREDDEVQILIADDSAAKGLDLEFCPVEVNYNLPYNSIIAEQRICRCHRQGQMSDVLVINMLSKENFADVRLLELINKRTLQFNGIFGLSDDIVGNFDVKIKEVLKDFRHRDEVAKSFKENLAVNRPQNEQLVENTEDVLFTTFTKSIADKLTITPKYIEEKTDEINTDLWELVKYYFTEIKPDFYEIDDTNKTLTRIEAYRPYLFTYREDSRKKKYEGCQKYGLSRDFKPVSGRITFTSIFAKGILNELDVCLEPEAKIYVNAKIAPCEIGFYYTSVTSKDFISHDYRLIGQTKTGETLMYEQCRDILNLPVVKIVERDSFEQIRSGNLLENFAGAGNLDDKVSKEEILKDYLRRKQGSFAFEIEKIKLLAGREKSRLEFDINEIRAKVKDLTKALDNKMIDKFEKLKIQKQLNLLKKDLLKNEKMLFYN
ncbi:MAG: DEAD/DEAH box helicase, partial [Candidatus Gastranaerophilales bacterium]|nr:DEAD/DEAH box helicase [Candidatus Gastranaerophilales bacterium]